MNRIAHTKRLTALAATACFVVVTMVGGAEAAAPADSQAPPPIAATCVAGTAENPLDQTDESMQACMMAQIGLVASPNPTPPGGVVSFTWSVSPATDCWDNLGNSAWGNYSFSRAVNSSFTWTVYCTGNGVESNSLNIVVSNPTDPPPPPPGGGYVPALTSPPTISGTTEVGNTLAANRGSWTNSPTSYSYAWRRSGDLQQLGSGSALALTSAHVGYQIRVDVMACNGTGCSSWASSGWTATVSQPPPPPVYACSNGWDDDGDGKVDYPNDPGCISSTDNDEYNAPSTATLTAYPTSITAGSSSTLTWSSSNATSCSASWTSSTATSGSATVRPAATTKYSITCNGAGGSITVSTTVTVIQPAPTPTPSPSDCTDEYDAQRNITYRCTPDGSGFYTPDGIDPTTIRQLTYVGSIPPPAPYRHWRDYCSDPWFSWNPYESMWNPACYRHDVNYGSQVGRQYADTVFWKDMSSACRSRFNGWLETTRRWDCLYNARKWYYAIRWFGEGNYRPRQSSSEPAGE